MTHYVIYEGVSISLAAMQEVYMDEFAIWANKRIGIEGTQQRGPYDPEAGKAWVRKLSSQRGEHEVFAVLLHETTEENRTYRYVGHTGLHSIKWPDGWCTSGSVLGPDGSRGRGCGTEAKLFLLYHAFNVLGLRKVCSSVKSFNAPSLGHLVKCGYRICGRRLKHDFHEGSFVDELQLEVFREEWLPIWERYQKTKELPKLTEEQRLLVSSEAKQH